MRNYVSKKCGISKNVYMQVRYKLADYDRLKMERINLLYGTKTPPSGMPKGNRIGNPTEEKAVKLAYIDGELEGIDQAAMEFRGRFSGKVYEDFDVVKAYFSYDYFNYMHIRRHAEDMGPCERTWRRFKWSFSEKVAEKLKLF